MATAGATAPPRSAGSARRSGAPGRRASGSPALLSALPFGLLVLLFFAVPLAGMAIVAFQVTEHGAASWGLQNFRSATSGTELASIGNSVLVSAVSATIAALVGGVLALIISRLKSSALDAAVPVISSVLANSGGVMLAFSFIVMLGNTGVVTVLLGLDRLGFTLYSWPGLVVMYQYFLIPTMVLVTLPAFAGIKEEWVQASAALGGGQPRFWTRVGIPVLSPSLAGAWVLLFGASFATHASPAVLLSTGTYPLVPLTIASQLAGGVSSGREGTAMALGLVMVVVALGSLVISSRLQQRALRWAR